MRLYPIAFIFCSFLLSAQDPMFQEITMEAGLAFGPANNNSVVVGDFNNDGFEDFFVPCNINDNALMLNQGDGTFVNVIDGSGIEKAGLTTTGVWGDIDNDGDLDLFVGNYNIPTQPYSNYLYLNDGNGVFTDISISAGISTFDQTRSVHMVDLDLDGHLDIYVCNLLQQNTFWKNNGNNTFTNNLFFTGLGDTGISMGAVFFDYDNDGDQDIYLTHDGNQQYIMYENVGGGQYRDVSAATKLNVAAQGMGVDFADINNDGHMDLYVTNLGPNFLLVNQGDGTYEEVAEEAGVADMGGMGWGCFFLDYDNDGWEDIYVINDSGFSPATNKLYKNNADESFTLVSEFTGLSSFNAGIGGNWSDYNNDGYPDIMVANREANVGVQLFENRNSGNNWIGFDVEASGAKSAFGTRIQLMSEAGLKIDEKTSGSSYASQSSHKIYFGLGQGVATDIIISWPDGSQERLEDLPLNQVHKIIQSSVALDADGDGYTSTEDCDDNNPEVNPGTTEVPYNGVDDDCDVATPDDDLDQDGYLLADDCNDEDNSISPGLGETIYNGIDDDCDPSTLDDDLDQDGYVFAEDCNDQDAAVYPGATETAYNGVDDDCDPSTLDNDLDQDGYLLAEDCNDENAAINPAALEITYNGIDDDCNPSTLDDDLDQDGYFLVEDCNDENTAINPGAEEIPDNGIDENCDGEDLMTAVEDIDAYSWEIYPNPTTGIINIPSHRGSYDFSIIVYDISGVAVATAQGSPTLYLGSLKSGIYLIRLLTEEGSVCKKLVMR